MHTSTTTKYTASSFILQVLPKRYFKMSLFRMLAISAFLGCVVKAAFDEELETGNPQDKRHREEFPKDQGVIDADTARRSRRFYYRKNQLPQPVLIFRNIPDSNTQYLCLSEDFADVTTRNRRTEYCHFKMLMYDQMFAPIVLLNVGLNRPLDMGKKSRIGENDDYLYKTRDTSFGGIDIIGNNDTRFFYALSQRTTHMFTFRLMVTDQYLVVNPDDGTLFLKYYPDIEQVGPEGRFELIDTKLADQWGLDDNSAYRV